MNEYNHLLCKSALELWVTNDSLKSCLHRFICMLLYLHTKQKSPVKMQKRAKPKEEWHCFEYGKPNGEKF